MTVDARPTRFPIGASATIAELEGPSPHALHDRLRAAEPVSWLPVLDGWLVTRRDLVSEVMRDAVAYTVDDPRFTTAQVVGPSMLSLDGAEHARHRAPFAHAFRLDAVRTRFAAIVEELCDGLLDRIERYGEADLRTALSGPLSVATMAVALGLDDLPPDVPLGWYRAIVTEVTDLSAGRPVSGKGEAAFDELARALVPVLERGAGSSLLADALKDGEGLTAEEAVSNAAVLLFGGIETTDGMIANLLHHVLSDETALAELREQPSLVENAVEESLRLEPAAAVLDRYTTGEVELAGVPLGERELVRVSLSAANRDPAVFSDPHRLDLHRPATRLHTTFAHGPHVCLGLHLARLEARVALTRVLERLPDVELAPGHDSAPDGLVFRKPPELRVRWRAAAVVR